MNAENDDGQVPMNWSALASMNKSTCGCLSDRCTVFCSITWLINSILLNGILLCPHIIEGSTPTGILYNFRTARKLCLTTLGKSSGSTALLKVFDVVRGMQYN